MTKENVIRYFRDLPELETERLLLRRMKKLDYRDMYDYACREDVTQYLTWYPHPNPMYTLRYLTYIVTRYRAGEFFDWAVVCKENRKMIGTCGFTTFHYEHNSAELGYVLHPDYWGKGLAPEAVRAVMDIGFRTFQLHRIEARFMEGNDRSRRVMEKVGMTFEGMQRESMYIKEHYVTVGSCAILSSEYRPGDYTT